MLSEGIPAPNFALPGSSAEGDIENYRISDAIEDGSVVLNFYVFDFHPECTEHLCDLNNLAWFSIEENVTVFGISSDRSFSHQAFAESERIEFPLLSDSDGTVAEKFGVLYDEYEGHKRIAKRSVFVIDGDGVVRYSWSTDDPSNHPDWRAVERALDSLDHVESVQ